MVSGLVIIMNPPWRVGQRSENDANKNVGHPDLEQRVKETYVRRSKATNKGANYDYYVQAIRWASDRVKDGAIGMVTNSSFLEAVSLGGVKECLKEEFSFISTLDLKGDRRCRGIMMKKQGGNVFGVRTGVAITILIKSRFKPPPAMIFQEHVPDYQTAEEKLRFVRDRIGFAKVRVAWSGC